MTDRELMQQALDYLDAPSSKVWAAGTQYKIIQALRARLAQPKHEWQGLTDEQIEQIEIFASSKLSAIYLTEAQLKGKNT